MIASLLLAVTLVPLPQTRVTLRDNATGIPVTVRIAPFSLATTEVTQKEFREVTGFNPSTHRGDNLPVHNVTWWEAIRFCNLLSLREGLAPVYDLATGAFDPSRGGYRLPTDAEWIYAAGEGKTPGHLGEAQTKDAAALLRFAQASRPQPVAKLAPNARGLFDMTGNVWEWVQDFNDPTGAIASAVDPAGPPAGVARILRGGSYLSSTSSWSKGYRSSVEPGRRSPYTGFRVCRTTGPHPPESYSAEWFVPYQQAPPAFTNQTGNLTGFDPHSWQQQKPTVNSAWQKVLGRPATPKPPVEARLLRVDDTPAYRSRIMELRVETDYWEKIAIFLPHRPIGRPLPVVIVPYYDVDTPAGTNLGGRLYTPLGTRSFAHLAVQQGFAAVAIRWFGESYAENYAEAVASLKLRHPDLTGLGKWVWDSQRLLDYLETLPELDPLRIGIIGHSLGGKMALYASAFDPRITAVVSSEPGIGLSFSNYEDFWYLGENLRLLPSGGDHHQLLAMIAPRPFLLIGGDSSDNDKSWHFLNAVKPLYRDPNRLGYINHRKGHSPTPESIHLSMEWLRRFLAQ
jgi:hypothetical protein